MYKIILFDLEKYTFQIRTDDKEDRIIANSIDFEKEEKRDETARILAGVIGCNIYTLSLVDISPLVEDEIEEKTKDEIGEDDC